VCSSDLVLAGLTRGIEGEVFNVIDDDLPTSRNFLRQYKNSVGNIKSIYVPKVISFLFCWGWEKLSTWSRGQLPPVFTRREWIAYWEKTYYDNGKIKAILDWRPEVQTGDGLRKFFEFCKT
jgi:nucleoside-diphosphate-sugar epimerase